MDNESKLAKPLEVDPEYEAMRQAANQAAQYYVKNTEFVCNLGGGNPKATIHNLRMMAFVDGFEKAWKLTKLFSEDVKNHGH